MLVGVFICLDDRAKREKGEIRCIILIYSRVQYAMFNRLFYFVWHCIYSLFRLKVYTYNSVRVG